MLKLGTFDSATQSFD